MIMVISIGKEHAVFESKVNLKAVVDTAATLKPGAFVELRGIRVGVVDNIKIIDFDKIEIILNVSEKFLPWIKKDSQVSIKTAGLVGDKFIEITGGQSKSSKFDPSIDKLYSKDELSMDQFLTKGDDVVGKTKDLLSEVQKLLSKLNEEKFGSHLSQTGKDINSISRDIAQAQLKNTLIELNKTSKKINSILERVENGPGTLNSLIYDNGLYQDMRKILGGAGNSGVLKYFIRKSLENKKDDN